MKMKKGRGENHVERSEKGTKNRQQKEGAEEKSKRKGFWKQQETLCEDDRLWRNEEFDPLLHLHRRSWRKICLKDCRIERFDRC